MQGGINDHSKVLDALLEETIGAYEATTSSSVPERLKSLGAPARLIYDRRNSAWNVLWRTEMRLRIGYSPALGTGNTRKAMTASTAHSSRILIVEDVQETRDSIRELLTRDGYRRY